MGKHERLSKWVCAFFALVKFNNDGTVKQIYDEIPTAVGLWTNPSNGHLHRGSRRLASFDIDVSGATPTFAPSPSPMVGNGMTVSRTER